VPYYLGIDGGGTKTTCAVGDSSMLLATATSGPSNIVRVGQAQARDSLHRSVRQACTAAGITPEQVERTCVGGSGAARPELAQVIHQILGEIVATPVDVVGDMEIALEAAVDDGPGVIVIAGTGSIAYGRDRKGRTLRAGGWGFAIGDEGSAHWIGRSAIASLLRASDQNENVLHSSLAQGLMRTWKVNSLADLARAGNSVPPPDFAALFPAVVASDDDIARQVLTEAAKELAELAATVVRRLFFDENGRVPVGVTGGVFRHAELVREIFYNQLRRLEARTEINPRVVDPVEGALRMARRASSNHS
jgi:N-acetylglucosamine kinase-like BadF-type ATPase